MKVLLVKTSSMGDLIHTFPALTDAMNAIEGIEFHWLVEEAFQDIPTWHPAVSKVILIGLRRWRKNWRKAWQNKEIQQFKRNLRKEQYDLIIDAQGLIKSAIPAFLAKGKVAGFDKKSIKESLASLLYQNHYTVAKNQHAIFRTRHLFSQIFNYSITQDKVDFGIQIQSQPLNKKPYLLFLHGTTWKTKFWPELYWIELCQLMHKKGYVIYFPMVDKTDQMRVEQIIKQAQVGELMKPMGLQAMAESIKGSSGVVGVDSGLAHLTAALNIPAVTLFGATDKNLTGAIGQCQINLQSEFGCSPCLKKECSMDDQHHVYPPCFQMLPASMVAKTLVDLI